MRYKSLHMLLGASRTAADCPTNCKRPHRLTNSTAFMAGPNCKSRSGPRNDLWRFALGAYLRYLTPFKSPLGWLALFYRVKGVAYAYADEASILSTAYRARCNMRTGCQLPRSPASHSLSLSGLLFARAIVGSPAASELSSGGSNVCHERYLSFFTSKSAR